MGKSKAIDIGDYAHIYNRGVDKRNIVNSLDDLKRFLESMQEFNTEKPIGSIRDRISPRGSTSGLVEFVAYCVNYNHFHFIVRQKVEGGIQKFMHRISTGYTMYYNQKHNRSGVLFQGRYKCVSITTNEQLLHTSVYVNLNDRVHKDLNPDWFLKVFFSSFHEYKKDLGSKKFCDPSIILEQYKSREEYCEYTEMVLPQILQRKERLKEVKRLLIE